MMRRVLLRYRLRWSTDQLGSAVLRCSIRSLKEKKRKEKSKKKKKLEEPTLIVNLDNTFKVKFSRSRINERIRTDQE